MGSNLGVFSGCIGTAYWMNLHDFFSKHLCVYDVKGVGRIVQMGSGDGVLVIKLLGGEGWQQLVMTRNPIRRYNMLFHGDCSLSV